MYPFLKWAGGKRWLVNHEQFRIPEYRGRYVEPFLGGGAAFFSHQPDKSLIADINCDLIGLYQVMRDYPNELYEKMLEHQIRHNKEYYYEQRELIFSEKVVKASQFLYLNRTCWNGLYRVNKKGIFNVPIGTKDTVLFENENFSDFSIVLKDSIIAVQDFEKTIDSASEEDFIFCDPPYTVKHNMNGFVKYNEKIFSWDDQIRLSAALMRAARRGAHIILTNADHEDIRELYSELNYTPIVRASVLAGKSSARNLVTEAIFFTDGSIKKTYLQSSAP